MIYQKSKIQSNDWPGKNSSKESMKNIMDIVVQKETWVMDGIRWCDTCQSKDSRRNGKCDNEKEEKTK